jgi:hypothetical protein
MRATPNSNGKQTALQREIARRDARGALRAGYPNVASSMRSHVYSAPHIFCDHRFGVYGATVESPQCRAEGSCGILDLDFGEHLPRIPVNRLSVVAPSQV